MDDNNFADTAVLERASTDSMQTADSSTDNPDQQVSAQVEDNSAAVHVTVARKARKNAAIATKATRPIKQRRSFSYARRQR